MKRTKKETFGEFSLCGDCPNVFICQSGKTEGKPAFTLANCLSTFLAHYRAVTAWIEEDELDNELQVELELIDSLLTGGVRGLVRLSHILRESIFFPEDYPIGGSHE